MMSEQEKLESETNYAMKVVFEGFLFDEIRTELEEKGLHEKQIASIIKEVDDIVLLNSVEPKLAKRRFKYEKSGVGILVTMALCLFYLAYSYEMIKLENLEFGLVTVFLLTLSFIFYKKEKKPQGKFVNKNKFKND
tara:strand:+ start:161743 stop:162150 length:408 start_codon:yes stop_codon:yes gene_type:complete